MIDFKPGDEVVCVDASVSTFFANRAPSADVLDEGRVYTVLAVSWDDEGAFLVVHLVEVQNGPPWGSYPDEGFRASRFRKVQRRDLSAWLATENIIEEPKRIRETESA